MGTPKLSLRAAGRERTSGGWLESDILGDSRQITDTIDAPVIWRHAPKQESAVRMQWFTNQIWNRRLVHYGTSINNPRLIDKRRQVAQVVSNKDQSERVRSSSIKQTGIELAAERRIEGSRWLICD